MGEPQAIRTTIADISGKLGTREKLMTAGEELIGSRGYDNVALEDIARSAGQGNKYAVQYHFGGREGLVQSILDIRLSQIDRRRMELVSETDIDDPASIIMSFIKPLSEQVDSAGYCSFARIILHYATRIRPWPGVSHPITPDMPVGGTKSLFDILCVSLFRCDRELLAERLTTLMILPLSLLSSRTASAQDDSDRALDDAAVMMAAALAAESRNR